MIITIVKKDFFDLQIMIWLMNCYKIKQVYFGSQKKKFLTDYQKHFYY